MYIYIYIGIFLISPKYWISYSIFLVTPPLYSRWINPLQLPSAVLCSLLPSRRKPHALTTDVTGLAAVPLKWLFRTHGFRHQTAANNRKTRKNMVNFNCWSLTSPPARWGLLEFKIALRAFFFFCSSPPCSSWSQWALLDLNCQIPPAPDPSGRRWTSTTISRYQRALLDLNQVSSLWALTEVSGHRWTSTGDLPEPSGHRRTSTAGWNAR